MSSPLLDVPLPYAFLLFIEEFCTLLLGSEDMSTLLPASSTAWLWTAAVQPSRPTKAVHEAKARNGGNGACVHLANNGDYVTQGVLAYSARIGNRPAIVVVGLSGYSSSRDHHGCGYLQWCHAQLTSLVAAEA